MFLDISWPGKSFTLSGLKAACPPGPGKVTDSEKHCPGSTCSRNKLLTVNKVDSTSKGQYFCGQREQNKHGFKVEVVRLKHLVKADQNPCLFQQEVSSENTRDSWQSLKSRKTFTRQQVIQPQPSTELQFLIINIRSGEKKEKEVCYGPTSYLKPGEQTSKRPNVFVFLKEEEGSKQYS